MRMRIARDAVSELQATGTDDTGQRKSRRGGLRVGAGRKPYILARRKESPAYVSMTQQEKLDLQELAAASGLTLSFYLRKRLDLPID